ncbi:hypothetical protein [Bifidobacterium adolescentis]|jgi:hypothetical protein|uniref:hypothetical protein n=1 Tax=Bifidobacterium adolescentis TaxID=1680 RepID=UPI0023EC6BEF|nr:hypothetical protein [Bifidobacterium adolescentis]MDF4075064.1 hypothetical protein [Bifidobacterium adolescentis]MDF4077080.1 hypothetical protein [Bifidobacterium adolescentis]
MMDGLDKLIISLVILGVVAFAMLGLSIYEGWYLGTHPDYGMTTVKTGDVTWVCLTDRGTTIGCDTVEEYR